MTMSKKPILYRIGSIILGPIYKFYYNPKIIDKEKLHINGAKLIVGNHIHLFDQCNTIISTKEFITFMAKKEYFDSASTRWFFSSVGCIPVDRSRKDDDATNKALSVLSEYSAIGLFPEGTRNALKESRLKELYEEYKIDDDYKTFVKRMKHVKSSQVDKMINLLNSRCISALDFTKNIYDPDSYLKKLIGLDIITEDEYYDSNLLEFKFGAVSMAKKEDAYLIPTVITGHYKFRSKDLIVRFGDPFKITDMDLEDANKLLRDKMLELIKENYKSTK